MKVTKDELESEISKTTYINELKEKISKLEEEEEKKAQEAAAKKETKIVEKTTKEEKTTTVKKAKRIPQPKKLFQKMLIQEKEQLSIIQNKRKNRIVRDPYVM